MGEVPAVVCLLLIASAIQNTPRLETPAHSKPTLLG